MPLSDLYNPGQYDESSSTKAPKRSFLSRLFSSKPEVYTREPEAPKMVPQSGIASYLRELESSGGTSPNTPPNVQRRYIIPAVNGNEKSRIQKYMVGSGGEYGLTPVALGELAKSIPDRNAPAASSTKHGLPLLPGRDVNEIQQKLKTPEGAGELARDFFMLKKASSTDWTPETITQDYMDNYVTKGSPNYTKENFARTLAYFKSLVSK
jgi:hypothetical protein